MVQSTNYELHRRSPNDSANKNDPMKYARNVMMNISTQDNVLSMPALNGRTSPGSDTLTGVSNFHQKPRSPFISNDMDMSGVLSMSALGGQSPNKKNHQLKTSADNGGTRAMQQFTNTELVNTQATHEGLSELDMPPITQNSSKQEHPHVAYNLRSAD